MRGTQHHLMNILTNNLTQRRHIPLHPLNKRPNIPLHLLGRKPQLPNRHPHHPHALPILAPAHHIPHRLPDILNHSPRLRAGHQTARAKDARYAALCEFGQAVRLADTALEVYAAVFDGVEDALFAYETRAHGCRGGGVLAVRRADHGDADVGSDGVGEAEPVADDLAVFGGAQPDVQFVFCGGGGAADFCCAEVSEGALEVGKWMGIRGRKPHCVDKAELLRLLQVGFEEV